jgi:xanthine/uracil permease
LDKSASVAPLVSGAVYPVDEVPAARRLIALEIQHVLIMYAGSVAVPLIIGACHQGATGAGRLFDPCVLLAYGIASLL